MSTQYTDRVINGMQSLYGEGFLSPGGPDEMAVFLEGIDLSGCHVLDLGCGIGGASIMLADTYGASHVTGVDVGADLVEVAPVYDTSGNTSLLAANLLFEMLCVLPGVKSS